ncbi:hypothetical protein [Sutcliffiella deserti]|uniref:hypothetical protein n=1 Tax=Sutcliffiella deserti TaxID=2875501 RepID=UPI001CBFD927|nr:hypothetical protein [Sutcliffiella deserti]
MKYLKIIILGFMVVAISFSFVQSSSACSCLKPGSPLEELQKYDAVFAGEIINVDEKWSSNRKKVKIKVKDTWKGINITEVNVYTYKDSAGCGVNFELGKEYIVYANLEDGIYTSSLCSRTAELANAQEDLQQLGKGNSPVQSPDADNKNTDRDPTTDNIVFGTLGVVLVLGSSFLYRWKIKN